VKLSAVSRNDFKFHLIASQRIERNIWFSTGSVNLGRAPSFSKQPRCALRVALPIAEGQPFNYK
jgi:hypothetical protein